MQPFQPQTIIEPFRVRSVEPIRFTTMAEREEALRLLRAFVADTTDRAVALARRVGDDLAAIPPGCAEPAMVAAWAEANDAVGLALPAPEPVGA